MQDNDLKTILEAINNLNNKVEYLYQNTLQNEFKPIKTLKLFEYIDEWYNIYKKPNLKVSSLYQIKICINNHIKKNIENKNLTEYSSFDIDKALNKIQSSRMRKYTFDIYREIFRQAYKNKYIKDNISENITKVNHIRKIGSALTKQEQEYFLTCIKNDRYEDIYKLYLLTGCRKSELFSITWRDIDFTNKKIRIPGTKTICSDRFIPIFEETETILKKLELKPHSEKDKLFSMTVDSFYSCFKRLKKKYNFTFKIHSLRHTFATRCIEKGISIKVVQQWLGHSNISMTNKVYTHVQSDFEKLESEKFKNILGV